MRIETETLLLQEVALRLRAAIPKTVPMVGCDDPDELVQDGLTVALGLLQSIQEGGKKVSAGNLAYYATLALSSGRRSTGFRKTDALHPAARLNGYAHVQSMDEPVSAVKIKKNRSHSTTACPPTPMTQQQRQPGGWIGK